MPKPNKNSADYFSHDCDMRNDIKIRALRRKFGNTGYAVWCYMLETLTGSENFFAPYNTVSKELMAADFDIQVSELEAIIEYCMQLNLLQMNEDGQIYSRAHQRRFEDMLVKRERRREINRQNGAKGGNPNFQKGKPNPYYTGSEDNQSVMPDNQKISEDNSKLEENIREENRTEEKRKEKKIEIEYPYQDIMRLWNEICGVVLPKLKALNDSRRSKIRVRLNEAKCKTPDEMTQWAKELFTTCAGSRFLCGENNHQWTATFDWLFSNPTNWVKVMEGNYSNDRGANKSRTGVQNQLGVGEYLTSDGRRTYGSGKANIPLSAPPRPSEKYQWSAESNTWIMI